MPPIVARTKTIATPARRRSFDVGAEGARGMSRLMPFQSREASGDFTFLGARISTRRRDCADAASAERGTQD
jgi:hypothetical protein